MDAHPTYMVTYEDGFTVTEEPMTVDLYRELVMGYPRDLVESSYWGAYGGIDDIMGTYLDPKDLWEGENFERFTEQDYADGPDSWLMPVAVDHNITAWRQTS